MDKEMKNMEEKSKEVVLKNINDALNKMIAFHTKFQEYIKQNNNIDYDKSCSIIDEFNKIFKALENEKNELEKDLDSVNKSV